MKIKKGDNVVVLAGKDRGKKGVVLRTFPQEAKIVVEGVAMRKKHVRAKKAGQKGQIVHMPARVSISSVQLLCAKCQKATRIGYAVSGKTKARICKKCGAQVNIV